MKSGKGDKKLSSKREFRENRPSDSHALFTDGRKCFSTSNAHISWPIWVIFRTEYLYS
jgi:hypothetical protein